MSKHNQIHTLGAPHYKAHFRFVRTLKDSKCASWSEKYGISFESFPDSDEREFLSATVTLC